MGRDLIQEPADVAQGWELFEFDDTLKGGFYVLLFFERLIETLTGLFIIRLGFPLVGRHPMGGILTLIAAGFLILDGVSPPL